MVISNDCRGCTISLVTDVIFVIYEEGIVAVHSVLSTIALTITD